jgi:Peptidase propeptide and YPEB domain
MKRTTKLLLGGGAVAAVAIGSGVTFAVAGGGDDSEAPITGDALTRASEAALAETGGGRVTETEVGDEESYYEVEVTLDDGTQIDVQLDQSFNVVGGETDGAGEDDGADDD